MTIKLTSDARAFVDGVVGFIRRDGKAGKNALPKMEAVLDRMSAQAKKQKQAKVTTSIALTREEKTRLRTWLTALLGHDVEISESLNLHMVGGIKIEVGDWTVDTSLATQLDRMGESLVA